MAFELDDDDDDDDDDDKEDEEDEEGEPPAIVFQGVGKGWSITAPSPAKTGTAGSLEILDAVSS